ncbi:hypothetical protein HanPSC8_Chr13g0594281 [Helianthus annuus]|nr:hypothetical protein HanPSC8_Chr13g0594281 [Helianthus annuus]
MTKMPLADLTDMDGVKLVGPKCWTKMATMKPFWIQMLKMKPLD